MRWSRPCTTGSPGTPGHSSTTVTGALNNYMAEIAIGKAEQERVEQSSGFARLDEAAVEVVQKRWRFVPAQEDGRAVAAWVLVPMIFELKKR